MSNRRVAVLAVATFAVGTDAFVVAGVLPDIARSLEVSVAQAGQLVTVFALAYALLAPILATLTGRWPRRRVLLVALAVFVAGNVATALAPTFALVLAARVIAAAGATLVSPTSSVAAASLVPPAQRARAIALTVSGLTVSTALGAPLGTAVAAVGDWRLTMWFVAALGVLAAVAIRFLLPDIPNPPALALRERMRPLTDRRVLAVLGASLAIFTGLYVVYNYVSVLFDGATGGNGAVLALLMLVFGVMATVGNQIAGRMADRVGPRAVVGTAAALLAVSSLAAWTVGATLAGAIVVIAVFGLAAFAVTAPQQHRLITLHPGDASIVVALHGSFLYLAVSLAGGIGGLVVGAGGAAWIGPVAAVFLVLGAAVSEVAHRMSRRREGADPLINA